MWNELDQMSERLFHFKCVARQTMQLDVYMLFLPVNLE